MSATTSTSRAFQSATGTGTGGSVRSWAATLWGRLVLMHRAAETRRDLGTLEPRLLSDIGIGRADAAREAERWPWDLEPQRVRWTAVHRG